MGLAVAAMALRRSSAPNSPEPTFHAGTSRAFNSATASTENAELRNSTPASLAWAARPAHSSAVNSIRFQ